MFIKAIADGIVRILMMNIYFISTFKGEQMYKDLVNLNRKSRVENELSIMTQSIVCEPVSYTHLDVYKRQADTCPVLEG